MPAPATERVHRRRLSADPDQRRAERADIAHDTFDGMSDLARGLWLVLSVLAVNLGTPGCSKFRQTPARDAGPPDLAAPSDMRNAEAAPDSPDGQNAGLKGGPATLVGLWVMGRGKAREPAAGPVRRKGSCGHVEESISIEPEENGRLSWSLLPGHTVQGMPYRPSEAEQTLGAKEGDVWVFRGTYRKRNDDAEKLGPERAVHYRLKLDPTSGHLRGTRNDQNVWLAPLLFEHATNCVPSP